MKEPAMTRHLHAVLLAGLLAVAAPLAAAPAHADQLVVADARGVQLQPGQSIDAAQPIKLAAGQRVTLIAANGATIKLSGPFEGVPDPNNQRAASVADSLMRLASQSTTGTSALGTVRDAEGAPPTDPWVVDVSANGHRCVQQGASVVLWRPAAPAEQSMEIQPTDRAWQAQAKWPANADKLAMPANFPAQDDQGYMVAVNGVSRTVTLHLMPPAIATDKMRAAWMFEKGCTTQARILVGSLK
jgi:hypothetical protein